MKVFDLTLAGFDAGTDATDHLIKWIKAPDLGTVEAFARDFDLDCHIEEMVGREDLTVADGVDVVLNGDGEIIERAHEIDPSTWATLAKGNNE